MLTSLPDAAPPTSVTLTALSVVIPVYNEETWIRRSVTAVLEAGESAGLELEVVVVDDGSSDGTPAVVDDLAASPRVRVVHQANAGRMAARVAGVRAATNPWVLLLDARVVVTPQAFGWLVANLPQHPSARVWCGHVDVAAKGSPTAAFWSGLTKIGWRRYTKNPRLVSFGAEDFDQYPKGTTALFLERDYFLELAAGFDSLFDTQALASDDTRLLRRAATERRIWLSPQFAFTYHGKAGAKGFRRQAYFRGTTFVDSYLGQSALLGGALVGASVVGLGLAVLAVLEPKVGLPALGAAWLLVPVAVGVAGGNRREVGAAAALTPAFVVLFGAGVLRGYFLAARSAVRGRTRTS
ncbi:glycosyltransferase family 2 protein [Oerskovia paurometabola]|uniref:glycosyltransferase family 2 protein n=1 Tax=Oerskovia paurometabola TaxID=162170 RepID=UPI00382A0005